LSFNRLRLRLQFCALSQIEAGLALFALLLAVRTVIGLYLCHRKPA